MLDLQDYSNAWEHLIAWGIYLIAALILCLAQWQLTRYWQHETRNLLLVLVALFLFMPASVPGHTVLAPALIFLVFGAMTRAADVMAPALARLSLAAMAGILLVILESIWWRWRRRHR